MYKIIASNLRKYKSSMITLFLLIGMATLLLTIGFSVSLGLNLFYSDKMEELNSPHVSYFIDTPNIDDFITKATDFDNIKAFESVKTLNVQGIKVEDPKADISMNCYIQSAEKEQQIAPLNIIDQGTVKKENSILLPLIMKENHDYNTGNLIEMQIGGKNYTYEIYGFFEDIYYGSPMMGTYKLYVYDTAYKKLVNELPQGSQGYLTAFLTNDIAQSSELLTHVSKSAEVISQKGFTLGLSANMAKMNAVTSLNILSMIIIGFSFIVVIVALIVVRFSITTAVEDGIQSIGILKSIGYKSSQIVMSLLLQYGILTLIASLSGIVVSTIAIPFIGNIAAATVGFSWDFRFKLFPILLAFTIIFGLVTLTTILSAKKTRKITPITALRVGIETHNFKRNPFPLAKCRINIHISLVLKSLFGNLKQNIAILIIMIALSFASVFALQMYANMVLDTTAMQYMMGMPLSNVWVISEEDNHVSQQMFEEIASLDEVAKATKYAQRIIKFESLDMAGLYTSNDFASLNLKTITQGRHPIYENETAISGNIANLIHKKIGDIMVMTIDGKTEEFLITGITEQFSQMGYCIDITESGMERFADDYKANGMVLDLKEGVDKKAFIEELDTKYSSLKKSVLDMDKMTESMISSLESGVNVSVIAIIFIMFLIVLLILYLIIKVKILREKNNIGIFKALGFSSNQIITQIAVSFTCIIGIGSIIGGFLGGVCLNNIMSLLFSGIGIKSTHFETNYTFVLLLIIGLTLISFIMSSLVASRVKKISPYHLLIE